MIIENIARGNSQHANAFVAKPVVATIVVSHMVLEVVMRSIDLNGKASLRTIKIQNVGADGVLPSEAQTLQPSSAHLFPKKSFRQSEAAAQSARIRNRGVGSAKSHTYSPAIGWVRARSSTPGSGDWSPSLAALSARWVSTPR